MNGSYKVVEKQIVFKSKKINVADLASFEIINDIFALDKNHLYYNGKVTAVDPNNYQLIGKSYIADTQAVYYIMRTKLKKIYADPTTFQSLAGNYAKDKSYHFYKDKRIQVKDKETFVVVKDDFAVDKERIYFKKFHIHVGATGDLSETTIQSCDANKKVSLFISGNAVVLINNHGWLKQLSGGDPKTIRFINDYYLVDKGNYFYESEAFAPNNGEKISLLSGNRLAVILGSDVYLNGKRIEDADGANFHILDRNYYFDKKRVFSYFKSESIYKREPIPIEGVTEEQTVVSIKQLLQLLFFIFDKTTPLSKIDPGKDVALEYTSTEMPAYSVELKKAEVEITYKKQKITGTISSFLFLGSTFWSIARSKNVNGKPLLRLIYNKIDYDDGYHLIDIIHKCMAEKLISIATYLFSKGEKPEALLITHKIFQDMKWWGDRAIDFLKICPFELLSPVSKRISCEKPQSSKTTNLSRAKEIITELNDADLYKRLECSKELFGLLCATTNIKGFHKPIILPIIEHLQKEKNEHIKELLFQCLDVTAAVHFRHLSGEWKQDKGIYTMAYPVVQFLSCHGINADLNLARLWECAHVMESPKEIHESRVALEKVLTNDYPAPGMWWGESTYPNYLAWLFNASLRLAYFTPREEVKILVHDVYNDLNSMRLQYNAHASGGSFSSLQMCIARLCKRHDLTPPFKDMTNNETLSGFSNLYRTIHKSDFIVTENKVLQFGSYRFKDRHSGGFNLDLTCEGATQTVSLGDWIGVDYLLEGLPWGRQLRTQVKVISPKEIHGKNETVYTEQSSQVGVKSSFYWKFEEQEELQNGRWVIEISFPEIEQLKGVELSVIFDLMVQ